MLRLLTIAKMTWKKIKQSDENAWDLPWIWFGKVSLRKQTKICVYERKSCIDRVESTPGRKITRAKVWGCGGWGVAGCI